MEDGLKTLRLPSLLLDLTARRDALGSGILRSGWQTTKLPRSRVQDARLAGWRTTQPVLLDLDLSVEDLEWISKNTSV